MDFSRWVVNQATCSSAGTFRKMVQGIFQAVAGVLLLTTVVNGSLLASTTTAGTDIQTAIEELILFTLMEEDLSHHGYSDATIPTGLIPFHSKFHKSLDAQDLSKYNVDMVNFKEFNKDDANRAVLKEMYKTIQTEFSSNPKIVDVGASVIKDHVTKTIPLFPNPPPLQHLKLEDLLQVASWGKVHPKIMALFDRTFKTYMDACKEDCLQDFPNLPSELEAVSKKLKIGEGDIMTSARSTLKFMYGIRILKPEEGLGHVLHRKLLKDIQQIPEFIKENLDTIKGSLYHTITSAKYLSPNSYEDKFQTAAESLDKGMEIFKMITPIQAMHATLLTVASPTVAKIILTSELYDSISEAFEECSTHRRSVVNKSEL